MNDHPPLILPTELTLLPASAAPATPQPDAQLDAATVGFDVRLHATAVALPPGDPLTVDYSAPSGAVNSGETMRASGPRTAVIGILERAGYPVETESP